MKKQLKPYILKDYIINIENNHIIKDSKNLGESFRDSKKWREATQEEVKAFKSKKGNKDKLSKLRNELIEKLILGTITEEDREDYKDLKGSKDS